ncbi:MAG TPA: glycerol kinase GlpK [Leptolyngbyaceae cyanobacterium]
MKTNAHEYVLALDLGTTGSRAVLFDAQGLIAGLAYKELTQYYPQPGWLEHNADEIWQSTQSLLQQVLQNTGIRASSVAAIGLSVQRETCLLWDKTTGKPLHNAIVWQDRRTAPLCSRLKELGHEKEIQSRTGLVVDAYFSATKLAWLIEEVQRSCSNVNFDNVLAGTVDTWVLWNLTGGQVHATDHTNASRTMLMNLADRDWDTTLLDLFGIPARMMPQIQPSLGIFGQTDRQLLGVAIPIAAVFGDQQAALFAHGCNRPGMVKCTYGTGCFLISHTGNSLTRSHHQLLSTVAWTRAAADGTTEASYAIEGAMFTTGACIQWLRDGLKLIKRAAETEQLASQVADNNGVYFVPALSGLGAPRWDMNARGAFFGITGGVKREHMVRAVLEAIAYQVKEVIEAMNRDSTKAIEVLKVDGGASQNNFLMQFQADVLGIPIERPVVCEATATGAAFGAGLVVGFWSDYDKLVHGRKIDKIFEPTAKATQAQANFATWLKAVNRSLNWVD